MVKAVLVSDNVTAAPPAGAAFVKITVHVPDAFGPRLAGQDSEETSTGAVRLRILLAAVPLYVAVTVTL